eukprot:scaffold46208_cov139-Skeletonema_marinoi.AAC.2
MSSSFPGSAGIPLPLYDGPPPTSSPSFSYQPTISVQPSSQPSSTFLRASNSLVNSDRTTNNFWTNSEGGITPSSVGFWMIMSLIGLLLCLLRMKFVEKSQSIPSVVDDGDKKIDKMIQDMMDDLDRMQFDFQMPAPKNTKENLVGLEVEVHSTTSGVQENQDHNIPPSPNPHPAQDSAETLDGNQGSHHKLDPPVPPTSTPRRKKDNSKHKRRVGEEKDGRVREHRHRDKSFNDLDDSRKERHRNSDNNGISNYVEPPPEQPHQSDPDASPNQTPSRKGDKNYMRRGGERDRDCRGKEQKLENELKRSQRSMSKAQEKLLKEKTALKERLQKLEMKLASEFQERHSVEASLEDALKHNEALEKELQRNLEECDEKQEEFQALIVQLQQIQGALADAEVESSDRQEVINRLELQIKEQNDSLLSCENIIIGYKDDIQRLKNERNHTMTEKNKVVAVQVAQPNLPTPTPPIRKDDGKKKLYLKRHHDKRRRGRSANRYNEREPSPPRNIDDDDDNDDDDHDQSSATKTHKSKGERTWFSMFTPARRNGDNADDGVSAIHSMFDCSSSGSYPSLASM